MTGWHLAELNIARFRSPIDDPVNADFVGALDRVNALADASDGFVWRLTGEGNDAPGHPGLRRPERRHQHVGVARPRQPGGLYLPRSGPP
jgi:hypothetical protein